MEKILVVNNDIDTMTLLKQLLEKKLYSVAYTSSNEEVVELAKQFEPDLVLVDVLQKHSIAQLKTDSSTTGIPVIMMTGYSWNEKTNDSGADSIIEKPFFLDQLQQKIQSTLTSKDTKSTLRPDNLNA